MTLWFVFALMTVAAIFAVLWPLSRRGRADTGGSEVVVYRDQLAEIDRDMASGIIGAAEADAARIEISRRLLAAADQSGREAPVQGSLTLRRAAAIVALVG
ncbi:MAG: c-type cytochrome biogenesis protein CcmI, partial [Bradyrhizobium sp.]